MKKRALTIVLTLIMIVGLLPVSAFAAEEAPAPVAIVPDYSWYGDGTAAEFTIDTVEELAGLANITNGKDGQTKFDFAEKTVKLTADITFADNQYWYYANSNSSVVYDYRIGNFAGTFDGQENTITGLKFYNADISKNPYMYLFNIITVDGSVKNVTLDTVTADINGYDYFGFLAKTLNGSATNCHVNNATANVAVNKDNKAYLSQTAAMFGYVYSATVTDCTVTGFTINALDGTDTTDRVAALIGQANGTADKHTIISGCSVSDATFNFARKSKNFGSFVGQTNNTTITDCIATDINISVGTYYQNVGGFIGTVGTGSTFERCKINRVVIDLDSGDYGGYVGGFSSSVSGDKISFVECSVTNLDMDLELRYKDYGYVGGFTSNVGGSGSVTFEKCSVTGDITAEDFDSNSPTGGFFGYTGNGNLTVTECVANVNVTAPYAAGGFIGKSSAGNFTNCTANGDVSGNVAGGFAGEILPNSAGTSVSIDACEAGGQVLGTEKAAGFVGSVTTSKEDDIDVTAVKISNSIASPLVAGAEKDSDVVDFAKETIPENSTSHYTSEGNIVANQIVEVVESDASLTIEDGKLVIPAGSTVKFGDEKPVEMPNGGTITITENGKAVLYTVTLDANGGKVDPNTLDVGTDRRLEDLPVPEITGKYTFKGWYDAPIGGSEVTTNALFVGDTTIYAQWKAKNNLPYVVLMRYLFTEYSIEAKAAEGGTITEAGTSIVKFNTSKTYTIVPEDGYEIISVTVDGENVGAVSEYTFKLIRDDHTISAVFAKNQK